MTRLASTGPTAAPFLATKLRVMQERLREVEGRFVGSLDDELACHDLRVALRRTRTLLEVGRRVLGRFHADEVRAALRELQRATGALRDEEVLRTVIESLGVEREDVATWLATRLRREQRLRRALARRVQSGELARGRTLLDALLAFRADPEHDRRLEKFSRRAVERAQGRVERRRAAAVGDAVALHDLRIAAKRLRYTADTFAEALPAEIADLARTAARMQGRLGDLHDVDVAIAAVRHARSLSAEGRSELLVALGKTRAERVAAYASEVGTAERAAPGLATAGRRTRPIQAVGAASLRKISTR